MAYIPTAKIERLRERASRKRQKANGLMAEWNRNRRDWAYVTQPAGASSTFGRQRRRVLDRYDKGLALLREADELDSKADRLERFGIPEKGDAERKRQRRRDRITEHVTKGTRVHDVVFGSGTVVTVYKKSLRVKWDRTGSVFSRDKSYFTVLAEQSEPEPHGTPAADLQLGQEVSVGGYRGKIVEHRAGEMYDADSGEYHDVVQVAIETTLGDTRRVRFCPQDRIDVIAAKK